MDFWVTDRTARIRLSLGGRVQGVGFRPFVYRLARELELTGVIRNTGDGVDIEIQGTPEARDAFVRRLATEKPVLASPRVEQIVEIDPVDESAEFRIDVSEQRGHATTEVTPDLAACPDCLADMRNPEDRRRFTYALSNCTRCGPRFSVVRAVPYDRANTTLADFNLCPDCDQEYHNPADRRFHAQPTACRRCGPRVKMLDSAFEPMNIADPIFSAAQRLLAGEIVAIKGLGGFHLACLAADGQAVSRLRELKKRPTKPLAVMVQTVEQARRLVHLSREGEALLSSPAAPIVIARRRCSTKVATGVAPGTDRLGVVLAYTPLHHRLFDLLGHHPLVMTSANDDGSPMVFADADINRKLRSYCDAVLTHNRPIQRPVDDSVVLDGVGGTILVRRARGYVPSPVPIPTGATPLLPGVAYGGELKNTLTVARPRRDGAEAILSQHLGDLTNLDAFEHFTRAEADLLDLTQVSPAWLACDLHPGYASTRHALRRARELALPLHRVQHHHAHAAAVLAEHGHTGPAVAIVLDGTGYGPDNAIWGGEILRCTLSSWTRAAYLSYFDLPGGDAAAREPWRSALALLKAALGPRFAEHAIAREITSRNPGADLVLQMLASGASCIRTSSTGRLFDGVAALLNLASHNTFEAEAPAALESLADRSDSPATTWSVHSLDVGSIVRAVILDLATGVPKPDIAARFHATLAEQLAANAIAAANGYSTTVALGGGVLCNERLSLELTRRLESRGLHVLRAQQLPPNDGGLSYGQAVVASHLASPVHQSRWAFMDC
jgi:hydrogenase maturation protein HypF